MERAPERIGVAGDWHGNTAWAILDGISMRWLRFAGRPISNAVRGLASR